MLLFKIEGKTERHYLLNY